MMDGEKWRAFLLDLSFIGWWFLSGLTGGILGVFYVNPYYNATAAALYEALKIIKGAPIPVSEADRMNAPGGAWQSQGGQQDFAQSQVRWEPSQPEQPWQYEQPQARQDSGEVKSLPDSWQDVQPAQNSPAESRQEFGNLSGAEPQEDVIQTPADAEPAPQEDVIQTPADAEPAPQSGQEETPYQPSAVEMYRRDASGESHEMIDSVENGISGEDGDGTQTGGLVEPEE